MIGTIVLVFALICKVVLSRSTPVGQGEMPEICNGLHYCFSKSDGYPEQNITNIINTLDPQLIEGGNEIGIRQGFDRMNDDCERQINFEPIYQIVDMDGLVRYVVQSEKTFLQKIRTESCVNPGPIAFSSIFKSHELRQWNLSCEEKRIEFWFLVLSLDGSKFEYAQVNGGLPVCCSCRFINDFKK